MICRALSLAVIVVAVLVIHQIDDARATRHHRHHGRKSFHGRTDARGRPARHNYKKYTKKSIAIGESSNAHIQQFQNMMQSGQNFQSALQRLSNTVNLANDVDVCRRTRLDCDPNTRYRSADGSCNNLQFPYRGAAFTFLNRLLPDAYEDGFNEPRGGGKGKRSTLPNPRLISTTIHHDLIAPDPILTNMVPQMGQFVDHDLTLSPENDLECCGRDRDDADCFPIDIPAGDPFYHSSSVNESCLALTRSTPFCFPGTTGIREQMNSLTAYADASQVYGSDNIRQSQLRSFKGGRLRVNQENPRLLPTVAEIEASWDTKVEIMGTYAAGDERVNEMPALTVMHTLWVREHNRIADEVQRINPSWDDEQIFQFTRRLVIAEWQRVLYGEYLPIILGSRVMARYGLTIVPNTFSTYNPRTDPTIFQAFSTAAYRFGHTLINGIIRLMEDVHQVGSYKIRDGFFQDRFIRRNLGEGYDLILNGLMQQNSQTYDAFVTEDLTNFVLREPENNFGSDLIARNIQRAREHGVPPYNNYRRICDLPSLSTWESRPREIPASTWRRLQILYKTPYEIDLFTGGLSENPLTGAVTGPTFNCLKAMQFQRIKDGDRFFYTHGNQAGSFTLDQLARINARTLGDIICDNSNIRRTPKNVFLVTSTSNPWIPCGDRDNRQQFRVEDFFATSK